MRDTDRLPQYANRGEIIAINPRLWDMWLTQVPDQLSNPAFWDILTDPEKYTKFRAQPLTDQSPIDAVAPVDILMSTIQRLLLHEVSGVSCTTCINQ